MKTIRRFNRMPKSTVRLIERIVAGETRGARERRKEHLKWQRESSALAGRGGAA